MDNLNLIETLSSIKEDKNINNEVLMSLIKDTFKETLIRKYEYDNFDIIVNINKGDIEIWRSRNIVPDGEVENDITQISLTEALKIEDDFEVGEDLSEEIHISELGRRFINGFKQELIMGMKDIKNSKLYNRFKDLEGTIINGYVHFFGRKEVVIFDDDGNEFILYRDDLIPGDFFRKGDSIIAVIKEVIRVNGKVKVLVSRTENSFVERLFEMEIPEVSDDIITIKKISRLPGTKTKVIVETYDDRIDPVGVCVGRNGSYIRRVCSELNNENIDVIQYTDNFPLLVQRYIGVSVRKMEIDETTNTINVTVDSEDIGKAIGKYGSNIKMSYDILGNYLNIFTNEDYDEDVMLDEFEDVIEQEHIRLFKNNGYFTARNIMNKDKEVLYKQTGIDLETLDGYLNVFENEFN